MACVSSNKEQDEVRPKARPEQREARSILQQPALWGSNVKLQDETRIQTLLGQTFQATICMATAIRSTKVEPFRSDIILVVYTAKYGIDPLPQTEMSAYNRTLEISPMFLSRSLGPILLKHTSERLPIVSREPKLCIVLQVAVHCHKRNKTTMILPQSFFAVKQEADRSLPLPLRNTLSNVKKEGKHTQLQELDVAASLQHLKISCPRYSQPPLSDWMLGMFSLLPSL